MEKKAVNQPSSFLYANTQEQVINWRSYFFIFSIDISHEPGGMHMPTQDNIEVAVVRLEEKVSGISTRLEAVEKSSKEIYDLTVSVKLLASNVERMLTIQEKQETRISTLEEEPANNWKNMKSTVITGIISALVGGLVTWLGMLVTGVIGG